MTTNCIILKNILFDSKKVSKMVSRCHGYREIGFKMQNSANTPLKISEHWLITSNWNFECRLRRGLIYDMNGTDFCKKNLSTIYGYPNLEVQFVGNFGISGSIKKILDIHSKTRLVHMIVSNLKNILWKCQPNILNSYRNIFCRVLKNVFWENSFISKKARTP